MKRTTIACCLALFLISCGEDAKKTEEPKVAAAATTTPATTPEPPLDSATANKNWEMYMTPGEVHKMMASWNGTWTGEVTMWMSPDAPPTTSTAIGTNKMIMGGRYQQASFKGKMMGMDFEGASTTAYDNHKKIFITTWIDNFGTGMMTSKGAWDPTTKTISYVGTMVDPASGKEVEFKENFKIVDDNFHVMEMYCQDPSGKEFKTMEIKYTRKR